MIKNYLLIAIRNLSRYRLSSFINILGLALGISVFFIAIEFALFHYSWDSYHENRDHIYRIHQKFNDGGTTAAVSYPIKDQLLTDFPYIEKATSFGFLFEQRFLANEKKTIGESFIYIEPEFFDVFKVEFIQGNKESIQSIFTEKSNVAVISDKYAKVLFGDVDPIGKTITTGENADQRIFEIVAVAKHYPENTHFQFNFLLPIKDEPFFKSVEQNWNNPVVHTYVVISDSDKAKEFLDPKTLDGFIANHFPEIYGGPEAHLPVIPLNEIHLHSSLYYELSQNSNIILIYIVVGAGIMILLLACINFMNLTTAKATRRAKEVGLRKTMGAERKSLVFQFLGESIIFTMFAVIVGMFIAELFLPFFNQYLDQNLHIDYFGNYFTIPFLIIFGLSLGLISGLYPAVVLSAFTPLNAIKDSRSGAKSTSGFLVRKGLVVVQFIMVSLLLVTIVSMQAQLSYIAEKDLGFDANNLVFVRSSEKMLKEPQLYNLWLDELKNSGAIENAAGISNFAYQAIIHDGMQPNERKGAIIMEGGSAYGQTMGLKLLAGRFPDRERIMDKKSIIINETALEQIGWSSDEAIGKTITIYEGDSTYTVIGVVKDFFINDVTQRMEPVGMISRYIDFYPSTMLRLPEGKKEAGIEAIKKSWERFDDGWPMEIFQSQDQVMQSITIIDNLRLLMNKLTYLGIIIACLGLYGLTTFSTERRLKEIGIRKVLGSSITGIWKLILSEFTITVIIATGIGIFLGYFVAEELLTNFAYRIDVGVGILLLSAFITLFVAVVTVSIKALHAAFINPVDILKIE